MILDSTLARYDHIRQIAPETSARITAYADAAHNEAEFERDANALIHEIARDMGVDLLQRQQYTLATGRADAVYNRFIIEYEPPGSLRANLSHGHTAHAVQQVKDYIEGLAKAEKHDRDRLLGVAFDGRFYIYVRYHEGHFIIEEPIAHNPAATERFLRSLFSLTSGRALIPENLVDDFGHRNILAQDVTRALYNALSHHSDDLTAKLYAQWRLFFGETAGYDAAAGELKHKKELVAFARGMGLKQANLDVPRFFFAIHTYFSFLVKNVARLVLQAYAGGAFGTTPLTTIATLQGESLRRELEKMENGDIFRVLGLKNLLEGDFFAWYLSAWDEEIEVALRRVLARLAEYNPVTVQDDPYSARDLLKKLYHYLLPREIRHDLGEFYTPDWLAERLLNQLQEPLFRMPKLNDSPPRPGKRLLDPACGSGTFLILAARALKANCRAAGLAEGETLDIILNSVAGIDLNPLAVMAARVNLLLAVADLLPYRRNEIEIPVYLADSILTPSRGGDLFGRHKRVLETAVGPLAVPAVIDTRAEMEKLTDLLEEYVSGNFSTAAFVQRCRADLPDVAADPDNSLAVLGELFEQLSDLHRRGLDGIWARVLKNAFMPLFLEPFDYVVGNPPWINWESLPPSYRELTSELWEEYSLLATKGLGKSQFELGKQKRDLSTLMTYVVIDRNLRVGGKIGFIITQSVWKSSASAVFRRFNIRENIPFSILHVDDISSLQVFEGANTRTSIFIALKGQFTRYPVPYTFWLKSVLRSSLDYESKLDEVVNQTKRYSYKATPVDEDNISSPWLTARAKALSAVSKVMGTSAYAANAGVITWANAVYWVEVIGKRPDGLVIVKNITEGSKRDVDSITIAIEPHLLWPLLRGRDVRRWHAESKSQIILPHTPQTLWQAIPEEQMQGVYPNTFSYLSKFRNTLLTRSGYRLLRSGHPFYILSNVNDATFSPWKVVWRYIATEMTVAVVGMNENSRVTIPDHRLMIVPTDSREEADYIAAALNSSIGRFMVSAFTIGTQISAGVLERFALPHFDSSVYVHRKLSDLSLKAHELLAEDVSNYSSIQLLENEIDQAAADLWGLTPQELADVQASLRELKGE